MQRPFSSNGLHSPSIKNLSFNFFADGMSPLSEGREVKLAMDFRVPH